MDLPPIYAITDGSSATAGAVSGVARRLFSVGVRLLQVRERGLVDRELLAAVDEVVGRAREFEARVIVDDRVDVARLAGAGVHLGEDDLPAAEARAILPPGSVIGVSTHDPDAARRAFADPSADYVAFGPVFESRTKTSRTPRGTRALEAVAAGKTKPLVAIGGINAETLDAVLDAGADSAAVVGAIFEGGRLEENARRLLDRARRRTAPGRIYLVGFMGSGKTAIGRRVAARLGVPFVDLDAEIERTSGLTVRAIFDSRGEAAFRERESAFLAGTEALPQAIVSTGGGSYVSEGNRRLIGRLGTAVYLDVPFDAVRERLAGKTDRPLFTDVAQAAALHAAREPFYRMAAVRVSLTGNELIEESADRVLAALDDRRRPAVLL